MDVAGRYLDLMKGALTRSLFLDEAVRDIRPRRLGALVDRAVRRRGYRIVTNAPGDLRAEGRDWPPTAETMIGLRRLDNVQYCVETALADAVPGDLIEAGVWRGGAAIFMRAVLAAHEITDRTVWVADSFVGHPPPDPGRFPADEGDALFTYGVLAVSAEQVRDNFAHYDLFDDQVKFLEGWFSQTLPSAPIDRLAVVRIDASMYGSTWEALTALYPKLSPGGFVILDDYSDPALEGVHRAVDDYRAQEGITEPIERIDWSGAFWRKT